MRFTRITIDKSQKNKIRVISARDMSEKERSYYDKRQRS